MKYVDADLNPIDEKDCDLSKGYIRPFQKKVATIPATPYIPEQGYYQIKDVFFDNGEAVYDIDPADKRIETVDPANGQYAFIDTDGRKVKNITLKWITTVPAQPARQEWEQYEEYLQYIVYTEEELEQKAAFEAAQKKQQDFLSNGAEKIETMGITLDELVLSVADMIGA